MARTQRIAIVGAGIGGMTAAAALHQRGFTVDVYEQARALGEVGAGLQLAPNAVKVLRGLGLADAIARVGFEPSDIVSLNWDDGDLRYREPLKAVAPERYGAPYLMAHRADLHGLLAGLVPAERIHLGKRCAEVETDGTGARLGFTDGSRVEADVVIAGDGIHSVLREKLFGKTEARFTNQICWRATVPIDQVPRQLGPDGKVALDGTEYFRWLGPTGHVICYPIRAGRVLNIFAGKVSEDWFDESWSVPSSREELSAAYVGWDPTMLRMFEKVEGCFKWGIYDREPLPAWRAGRVVLMGDAAHPMMPTLAQGAAISMEDGYAAALALARFADDPDRGLDAYDAERRPRASQVQRQARDQFANNRKTPAPPPISCDWIWGYDPAAFEPAA
jgi:salicylate hydroxylase